MGYTHYWYRAPRLDAAKFSKAAADCRKVCSGLPIPIGDWQGEGEPEFADRRISFNGHVHSESFSRDAGSIPWPADHAQGVAIAGSSARVGSWFAGSLLSGRAVNSNGDGSYETFCVEQEKPKEGYWSKPDSGGRVFECCKTGYRPYDLLVQCCLVVLKEHLGSEIFVTSDGESEQWGEARLACQEFLGYGMLFELDDTGDESE